MHTSLFALAIFLFVFPSSSRGDLKSLRALLSKNTGLIGEVKGLLQKVRNTPMESTSSCSGRLTLETGVPVSTTDQSGGTLYYTPYKGAQISLYDGSKWKMYLFTEVSLALSISSGSNYDVFLYDNGGTIALELSNAWTNDTTRATAITLQDGVYVKNGGTTRRYVGTIRGSGANTTADSKAQRFVWNHCNPQRKLLSVTESADSWTYNSTTYQSFNSSTSNRVEYVVGISESPVRVNAMGLANGTGRGASIGIGIDSTSTNSGILKGRYLDSSNDDGISQVWAFYLGHPGLGYHYLQMLEADTNTVTFYGDNGDNTAYQSGLIAYVDG